MPASPLQIEEEQAIGAEQARSVRTSSALQDRGRAVRRRIALAVMILPTLGFVLAVYDGIHFGFAPWKFVLLAAFYILTLFGVEAGFHRLISHGAYVTPLRGLIVILGSMAAQGPAIFWAAAHRQHHAFSDDGGDPHSPRALRSGLLGALQGLWHGHMGWLIEAENVDWARFAPDLLKDRGLFSLNRNYLLWVALGLALPAGIGALVTALGGSGFLPGAWEGLLWGGLARIFLVHHAVWSVNSLCHVSGRRPFRCKGTATNNIWLALPSLGGAWHNNHHAFPFTADNQFSWWQFDFSGIVLRGLKRAKLVSHFRKPSGSALTARLLARTPVRAQS